MYTYKVIKKMIEERMKKKTERKIGGKRYANV